MGFTEDASQTLAEFAAAVSPNFPLGYCPREAALEVVQGNPADRRELPHLVFLNRRGAIVAQYRGSSDFLQYDQDREQNIRTLAEKLLAP